MRLDFETADPTDDIRVIFSDGRRAFVSAKRAVDGGVPLKKTVAGWVQQAPLLGEHDLLVIAGEEFKGIAGQLGNVLRRYRTGQPMDTGPEDKTLNALTNLLDDDIRDVVLTRARVLHVAGATESDAALSLQAAQMDTVVDGREGPHAVAVLAQLFHRRAGKAHSSDIEEWTTALTDAGLTITLDQNGTAGGRIAARRAAATAYLAQIAAGAGQIDLSLLADDLRPVTVENLLAGLRIRVENENGTGALLRYVRRWRRMLIVGQPGAGKSVATRELAAHCATHPHAPIPIRVSVPRLLDPHLTTLTLARVVEAAIGDLVDTDQRVPLAEHLLDAIDRGHAMIMCDGLDECGTRTAWIAQQLDELLESLHPNTGFILTTRANAERAAARLALPRVELATPEDLGSTVDAILTACAEARVPEADRDRWLAARRAWIKDARENHDQLLQVPLLAVLLALICADTQDADLPRGRATLLHRSVEQSVRRWEQTRHAPDQSRPWATELSPQMLLDGFVELGRTLDGGASVSRWQATDTLHSMLRDPSRWGLAPARASEVAAQILRFWDEHVAVFVIDTTDQLIARSRVFVEIATAMWAERSNEAALKAWLDQALTFTDSEGAIGLAADLDPRTITALLDLGEQDRPQICLVVTELTQRGIVELSAEERDRTLAQLATGVTAANEGRPLPARVRRLSTDTSENSPVTPDAWPFVKAACQLRLDASIRAQRAKLIARAGLDERASAIAAALCVLTDATTDNRRLDQTAVHTTMTALNIATPTRPSTWEMHGRVHKLVPGEPLASGLDRVALAAAHRLGELPKTAGERCALIAPHSPYNTCLRIAELLERAGIEIEIGIIPKGLRESARAWLDTYRNNRNALLEELIALDPSPSSVPFGSDELWSLPDVGAFLTVTRYEHRRGGAKGSIDDPNTRRSGYAAIADAYGLDKAAITRQARHVRDTDGTEDGPTEMGEWVVAVTDGLDMPDLVDDLDATLTPDQLRHLLAHLESGPHWSAYSAADVLDHVREPIWNSIELFEKDFSHWPRYRAILIYCVAITTAGEESRALLARAAAAESPDYRIAARLTVSTGDLEIESSIVQALCSDPDLSVRPPHARLDTTSAKHWSCGQCRTTNVLSHENCAHCTRGVRPEG